MRISNSVSRPEVVQAYRELLGREPESEEIIKRYFSCKDVVQMRELITRSAEYKLRMAQMPSSKSGDGVVQLGLASTLKSPTLVKSLWSGLTGRRSEQKKEASVEVRQIETAKPCAPLFRSHFLRWHMGLPVRPSNGLAAQGVHADGCLGEVFHLRQKPLGFCRAGGAGLGPKLVQIACEAQLRLFVKGFAQNHEGRAPLQRLQAHCAVDEHHTGRVLCQVGRVAFDHVVHTFENAQLLGQTGNEFTVARATAHMRVLPEHQQAVGRGVLRKRVHDTDDKFGVVGKVAVVHDLCVAVVLQWHKVIWLQVFVGKQLPLQSVAGAQVHELAPP